MTLEQLNRKVNDLNAKVLSLEAIIEKMNESKIKLTETNFTSKIIQAIADYYMIESSSMFVSGKPDIICKPRMLAMYIIRNLQGISHAKTGFIFKRDHSTCVYACKIVKNEIELYSAFKADVVNILKNLNISEQKIKQLT